MMNFLVLFFGLHFAFADPSVTTVRLKFHNSTNSESACKELISLLEPYNEKNNPLYLGYKGGATMLMAKYAFNPFSKFSYFKKGRIMLEKAIYVEKNNVELRFLRYTIQTNVPAFLGYNSELANDRLFLKQSVARLKDNELKKIITTYMDRRN